MSDLIVRDEENTEVVPALQGGDKKPANRKDMVKNVAIAFLSVMLILTFFSNTIMNYSLPQVATQQIYGGSISPQIRGTGTISSMPLMAVAMKLAKRS